MNNLSLLAVLNRVHVFDLDRTVIDSDHRVLPCYTTDGDLDLNKYRAEACKHELIQQDSLLPLASYMQTLLERGEKVVICTARAMSRSDYYFLRKNGLRAPLVLSRDQLHKHFPAEQAIKLYNSRDSIYKDAYFAMLQGKFCNAEFIVYDDHRGVLEVANNRGFTAIDAIALNGMLDESYAIGYQDGEQAGFDAGIIYSLPNDVTADLQATAVISA